MKPHGNERAHRRLETWLWTGPVGHLLGGGLDVVQGVFAYLKARRTGGGRSLR